MGAGLKQPVQHRRTGVGHGVALLLAAQAEAVHNDQCGRRFVHNYLDFSKDDPSTGKALSALPRWSSSRRGFRRGALVPNYSWFAALTAALRKYASGIFSAQAAAAMPRGNRSASDAGLLLVRGVDDIHELVRLQGRAPPIQAAVLPPRLKPRRGPLAHLTSSGGVNPPCGEVCFADPRTRSARRRRVRRPALLLVRGVDDIHDWSGFRDAPPIRPPSSRRG